MSVLCFKSAVIEIFNDTANSLSVGIPSEYFFDKRSGNRIDHEFLVATKQIAKRDTTTVVSAFQRIFSLPAMDFFRKLR